MFFKSNLRSHKGFTLTEAAIVLGIMGLILGAIWVAAAAVYKNMRVSTASTQMLQTVQNIRSLYGSQATINNGAAFTMTDFISAGTIPKDMVASGSQAVDVWGGEYTIAVATSTYAGDGFTITFNKVPKDACIELASRTMGRGRDSGLVKATITATEIPLEGDSEGQSTSKFISACSSQGDNEFVYTFHLKG